MRTLLAGLILALMSVAEPALAGVAIVFDYSLDSNGFFTSVRRALAQAVATSLTSRMGNSHWARVDTSQSGGGYELAIVNPSTLAVSWVPNVVIPEDKITVRLGALDFSTSPAAQMRNSSGDGATQLMAIRNVTGEIATILTNSAKFRPIDASITFDLQGIRGIGASVNRQWYFGSAADLNLDDRNPADSNYTRYTDFSRALIHELGHVLGIHDPAVFSGFLDSDPKFNLAWTSRVRSNGLGGYEFTGSRASQLYYNHVGQPIPLDTNTRSHWAVGVRSQTSDGFTAVTYDSGGLFRQGFSALEFAALEDIGASNDSQTTQPVTAAVFFAGWNLYGQSQSPTVTVASAFGDPAKVSTVWKWVAASAKWAFYTPTLTDGGAAYAATRGYDFLTTLSSGEGFWVNAKAAFDTLLPAGTPVASTSFRGMAAGWNLIATGDGKTPAQFNVALSPTQPAAGVVPNNITTLWAWDARQSNWYFYAPGLEANGGLPAFIASKGYLDFGTKVLDSATGFWVNKP